MLDHDWTVEETGDATLVEVVVRNPTAVARRVRVVNRLDGPALPPGRKGVPDAGWDEDGYVGTIPPNDRLTLGYACAAAPADPPVEILDEGRAVDAADDEPDAADAVRLLGDHAPPVDALPEADATNGMVAADGPEASSADVASGEVDASDEVPTDASADEAPTDASEEGTVDAPPAPVTDMMDSLGAEDDRGADDGVALSDGASASSDPHDERAVGSSSGLPADAMNERDGAIIADSEGSGETTSAGDSGPDATTPADSGGLDSDSATALPADVTAWLADVERRVDQGERLTDASVVEAAAVVEDRGGVDAVAELPDRLAADARALRNLADRVDDLTDRAAATDVPVGALRRLS